MKSDMVEVTAEQRDTLFKFAFAHHLEKKASTRHETMKRDALWGALIGAGLGLGNHFITPQDDDESKWKRILSHVLGGAALGGMAGAGMGYLRVPETAAKSLSDISKPAPKDEYDPNTASRTADEFVKAMANKANKLEDGVGTAARAAGGATIGGVGVPATGAVLEYGGAAAPYIQANIRRMGGTKPIYGVEASANGTVNFVNRNPITDWRFAQANGLAKNNLFHGVEGARAAAERASIKLHSTNPGEWRTISQLITPKAVKAAKGVGSDLDAITVCYDAGLISKKTYDLSTRGPAAQALVAKLCRSRLAKYVPIAQSAATRVDTSALHPSNFLAGGGARISRVGKAMKSKGGGIVGALLGAIIGGATYKPQQTLEVPGKN